LQNASLLLESGRGEDAADQVARARALAAEGLGEARAAVAALAPDGPTTRVVTLVDALDRMLRDHRVLTGVDVDADLRIDSACERSLSPQVVQVVVAVVREALTNTVRHAPGAPVRVSAHVVDGSLQVEVSDRPGRPPDTVATTGLGLEGMRARAISIGAALEAGPTATGWTVLLSVPVFDGSTAEGSSLEDGRRREVSA
jgi:signal transduction histidine kinase